MAAVNIVSGGCESTRKPPGRCEPSFSEPGQTPDRPGGTRNNSTNDVGSNQTLEEKLYHMPLEDYENILEYAKDKKSKVKSHIRPEHAEIISELEKGTSKGGEEAISTLSVTKHSSSLSSLNNPRGRKGEGGNWQQPDSKISLPLVHSEGKISVLGCPGKGRTSPTSPLLGKGKLPTQYFFNCRDDTKHLLEEDRRNEVASKEIESHACDIYSAIEEYDLDKSSRTRSHETSGSSSPRLADNEEAIRIYDAAHPLDDKERFASRADVPERPMRKGDTGVIEKITRPGKKAKTVAKGEIVTTSDKIPGYVGNKDPNLILEYLQISKPQKKSGKKEGRDQRRKGQDKEVLVKSVSLDDDNLSINSKTISESSIVGGSNREIVNKIPDHFLKDQKSCPLPINSFLPNASDNCLDQVCKLRGGSPENRISGKVRRELEIEPTGGSILAAAHHKGDDSQRLPESKLGEDEESYSVVTNRKRRNKESVKIISTPSVVTKFPSPGVPIGKTIIPLTVPLDSSFPPLVSSVRGVSSPNNGHCSLTEMDKLIGGKKGTKPPQKGAWKQSPSLGRSKDPIKEVGVIKPIDQSGPSDKSKVVSVEQKEEPVCVVEGDESTSAVQVVKGEGQGGGSTTIPASPTMSIPMSPSPPTSTPTLPSEPVIFCGENFKEPPILPSPDFEFGFGVQEALTESSKVEPCEVSINEITKPESVSGARGESERGRNAVDNLQGSSKVRGPDPVRMPGRGRGENRRQQQHMQQQPRDVRQQPEGVGLLGKFPPNQPMMTYSDTSVPTSPRQPQGPKPPEQQRKGSHPKQQLYKQPSHPQMMNPYNQEEFPRQMYFPPYPGHPAGLPMFQHTYIQGQPGGYQLPAGFFVNPSAQPHHYLGPRPLNMMAQPEMIGTPVVESIPGITMVAQNAEEKPAPVPQDVLVQFASPVQPGHVDVEGEDKWKDAISVGPGHQDLALLFLRPPDIDRQVFNPEDYSRNADKYVEDMNRRVKEGRIKICRK